MERLFDHFCLNAPRGFSRAELLRVDDLFAQRAALYFTPTAAIPERWIGRGPLSVTLPLALPSIFDGMLRFPQTKPRLWVDLLQRATGVIRWEPFRPARVRMVAYDSYSLGVVNRNNPKAPLDALKVSTPGRRDGKRLHYFGAIHDDNDRDLPDFEVEFRTVSHPRDARLEIMVSS